MITFQFYTWDRKAYHWHIISFYVEVLDIPCEQGIIKKRTFALHDPVCDPSFTIFAAK